MSKTIILEDLPIEAQRAVEDLFTSHVPVLLSREGRTIGGMMPIHPDEPFGELSTDERSAIIDAIHQGERDFEAGLGTSLEGFKKKYSGHLKS